MMRRQRLTDTQITELFDPPSDQRELVRHYTLSEAELATIRRCRGDHNRLGHARMLCCLRYPGRALRATARTTACIRCRADRCPCRLDRRISGCRAEPPLPFGSVAEQAQAESCIERRAILASIAVYFLIYWVLPNGKVKARWVLPAAVTAGLLQEVAKYAYILALPRLDFKEIYGPFYISVSLMFWAFLSGLLLLGGAHLSAAGKFVPREDPERDLL